MSATLTGSANPRRLLLSVPLALWFAFTPNHALAELGQTELSARNLVRLGLQQTHLESFPHYRRVTIASKEIVVRQFIDLKTGAVFGVSWQGNRMPELASLLGFNPIAMNGPGVFRSLHVLRIQTSILSLEAMGHVGSYLGRAVRTDLLPAGVSATEVAP